MSRRKSTPQSCFARSMYLEAMHSKSLSQTSTAPSDFIANFLTPGTHKRKTLNDLPTVVDESFCSLGSEERSKPHNYSRPPPFPCHNEETGRRAWNLTAWYLAVKVFWNMLKLSIYSNSEHDSWLLHQKTEGKKVGGWRSVCMITLIEMCEAARAIGVVFQNDNIGTQEKRSIAYRK